jgi:RNA polymerase-interacting CarD/CdnL/TRCF family regulator
MSLKHSIKRLEAFAAANGSGKTNLKVLAGDARVVLKELHETKKSLRTSLKKRRIIDDAVQILAHELVDTRKPK